MEKFGRSTFFKGSLKYAPILLLFVSVLNEFDFNYLELKYFSFNFPFILIFFWGLRKSESMGYGLIFLAGLINDVVVGFPLGISSVSYLLICGFAGYLRNITLRPNMLKDWLFFLLTISVVNSLIYSLLVIFFLFKLNYVNFLVNLFFTFLFYPFFAKFFQIYNQIAFEKKDD